MSIYLCLKLEHPELTGVFFRTRQSLWRGTWEGSAKIKH